MITKQQAEQLVDKLADDYPDCSVLIAPDVFADWLQKQAAETMFERGKRLYNEGVTLENLWAVSNTNGFDYDEVLRGYERAYVITNRMVKNLD